ncbi:MAG: ATP-dependent protease LonB [Clostridiales bacterium]|nr:ATP-dependent protease LonB [Clostridiales bacterium]
MGVYFYTQLRAQKRTQPQGKRESTKELENLRKMRGVSLSEPLAEHVRPRQFSDIVGQEEGIRSLMAILCGKNPQHVIIYGPPGVGKTCAARLVLEAAKKSEGTPFKPSAPFIEMDSTCVRFDERAIADPLLGSVHDPIYQGAGPLGVQGVPQPKPGAVTRAHGGVLFLDEIGELHPVQMNKLLKVLEDRKVQFESAYYNPDDPGVPRYIHEVFRQGMPADFRLVGATTRSPEEISPALRSRCMEIFFRALEPEEVTKIAYDAAKRADFEMNWDTAKLAGRFAACGRDAVNMVQMAGGVAQLENRNVITKADMEWVAESGHYSERPERIAAQENRVGAVHGLAVHGSHQGAVMEIEAAAGAGSGRIRITGIVEEEEMGGSGHTLRRKSTAHASAENVLTLLRRLGYADEKTDIHINFPGGAPVDGPSAGVAMAVVAISALTGRPVDGSSAVTGEIGVQGSVLPVGGVPAKVEAAKRAGLTRVLVPRENDMERFKEAGIRVIPIDHLEEALSYLLLPREVEEEKEEGASLVNAPLAAAAARP